MYLVLVVCFKNIVIVFFFKWNIDLVVRGNRDNYWEFIMY